MNRQRIILLPIILSKTKKKTIEAKNMSVHQGKTCICSLNIHSVSAHCGIMHGTAIFPMFEIKGRGPFTGPGYWSKGLLIRGVVYPNGHWFEYPKCNTQLKLPASTLWKCVVPGGRNAGSCNGISIS